MRYWILSIGLLIPVGAWAGPGIAVLEFGGEMGPTVREALVTPLSRRYPIIDGDALRGAAAELGIVMSRGPGLATAAQKVGAVAVIAGAVSGGQLSLAVFSGETGEVVRTERLRSTGRLSGRALRQALIVILEGLRKCPAEVATADPAPDVAPEPIAPDPAPAEPEPEPAPPAPAPVDEPGQADLAYDPNADTSRASSPPLSGADEEDPLSRVRARGAATSTPPASSTAAVVAKPVPGRESGAPRLVAAVGVGAWSRTFGMHTNDDQYTPSPPDYSSGLAAALSVSFKARPLAFVWDRGFLSALYTRAHFRSTVGLKSQSQYRDAGGVPQTETLGTSLWELTFEAGYDWKILDRPTSPHLELGLGYGMMDFALDWGASASRSMPAAAYRFGLFGLGLELPFSSWIGAHGRFDYRLVTGTGEIEDPVWYGPSSTGGVNMALGLNGSYKGFIVRAEYSYTRYFYAFSEATSRAADCRTGGTCLKAAGGALDILHGLTASLGYGF